MTTRSRRARIAFAGLLVPLVLASCKGKEKPAAQASLPPPPPSTTLATPPPPTTAPTPPPVWRTAHWGMTKEEVLAAFPGEAEQLPQAANFSQPQPGSSLTAGTSDVGISAHEAHGARFRVLFGFGSGDALDRVQLAAVKAGPHTCGDFEKELTQEHSAPAQRGSIGTSLRGEEVVWKKPGQTITLVCTGVASLGFQTVTLDYTAPVG
jgi:hypothetical protein